MTTILLAAVVAVAACGDDTPGLESTTVPEATTTTTAAPATTVPDTTTTAAPTTSMATTTTTFPWETHAVPATSRCVIGQRPGDGLNVRAGPSTDDAVVGTLAHDATGVMATGVGATDDRDRKWIQVQSGALSGWAAGWLLTANECVGSAPHDYCVIDTACTDRLNVREGPFGSAARLGSLAHDAVDVHGTGWVSADDDGRPWVQIEWRGGVGWAAGWFLTEEPCTPWPGTPCVCAVDGYADVLVHTVDHIGRFLTFDPIHFVWVGPGDTEGYWENPDPTTIRLPVADGVVVESCDPADDPMLCAFEDYTDYPLADLAQWVEDGTEVGHNRSFISEVAGHTGQLWSIRVEDCSVVEIRGFWVP